jgi:hypothetical protein
MGTKDVFKTLSRAVCNSWARSERLWSKELRTSSEENLVLGAVIQQQFFVLPEIEHP